jgi:hypothetical protein
VRRAVALVFVAVVGGCVYPATEVIVTLDTDAPTNRALTVMASVSQTGQNNGTVQGPFWIRGGATSTARSVRGMCSLCRASE